MESKILRIAVVSDLHFVNSEKIKDTGKHSWLTFNNGTEELTNNFWNMLLDKIRLENIRADLLICPGDIATYAEGSSLKFAWKKLNELGKELECSILATATGNHDVVSRIPSTDNIIRDLNSINGLVENLKLLDPPYPLVNLKNSDSAESHKNRVHYFGTDYLLFDETEDYRLVVLNSCSVHSSDPQSYERGHVTSSTLKWLDDSLKKTKEKKIGIFVCHHHPIQHDDNNLGAYDFINGGTKIMDTLARHGSWLVIHGHKHHAKLSYHMVGSKKIPVFSAGTLSSHKDSLGKSFANQFYILEVDCNKKIGTAKGKVFAYTWKGTCWSLSKSLNDGVFTGVGFGDISCLDELCEQIAKEINGPIMIQWDYLKEKFPELEYCVPKDLEHLQRSLNSNNVDVVFSSDKEIIGLEKVKV